MKILMVNKFLYPNGGSETYVFLLGKELIRQGNEVEYFGMEHPDRTVGNSAESYTISMDFHTGKIQKFLYPFRIIYSREARKKIRRVLDYFQPDIVHLNNFNFQLTPSIIYEIQKRRIPIVYTAHDSQLVCPNHLMQQFFTKKRCQECLQKGVFQCTANRCIHGSFVKSLLGSMEALLYRRLKTYRKIDIIICPSEFIKSKLDTNPDLLGRTRVLRNFIDVSTESVKVQHKKGKYVLYFGRYSEEKGVKTLLEVCRQTPEIEYCFAGHGPLREEILKYSNITDLGFLSGGKLFEVIKNAGFSVFPSECYENCPFSVMESIASGVPVVASDIGGIPELIENNVTGMLFEPGNVVQLRELIEVLWTHPEKVDKMSQNCKKRTFFSLTEYTADMIQIYNELLKREGKP